MGKWIVTIAVSGKPKTHMKFEIMKEIRRFWCGLKEVAHNWTFLLSRTNNQLWHPYLAILNFFLNPELRSFNILYQIFIQQDVGLCQYSLSLHYNFWGISVYFLLEIYFVDILSVNILPRTNEFTLMDKFLGHQLPLTWPHCSFCFDFF